MPGDVKVLIDEDTHLALAAALRQRGHDAIHVREADRLGLDDIKISWNLQHGKAVAS